MTKKTREIKTILFYLTFYQVFYILYLKYTDYYHLLVYCILNQQYSVHLLSLFKKVILSFLKKNTKSSIQCVLLKSPNLLTLVTLRIVVRKFHFFRE